jgi:hypothetical protein
VTLINRSTIDVKWYMRNGPYRTPDSLDWVAVTRVGERTDVVYRLDPPATFTVGAESVAHSNCNYGDAFAFTSPGRYAVLTQHNPDDGAGPMADCGGQNRLEVIRTEP